MSAPTLATVRQSIAAPAAPAAPAARTFSVVMTTATGRTLILSSGNPESDYAHHSHLAARHSERTGASVALIWDEAHSHDASYDGACAGECGV